MILGFLKENISQLVYYKNNLIQIFGLTGLFELALEVENVEEKHCADI